MIIGQRRMAKWECVFNDFEDFPPGYGSNMLVMAGQNGYTMWIFIL